MTEHLQFHMFWPWLKRHFNCITRVGGPDFLIFDQPDAHWHFDEEPEGLCVAQLYRNKTLQAEMVLRADEVLFVQSTTHKEGDNEETVFECVTETPDGHVPVWQFVLTHGYDEEKKPETRWTH